MDGGVAVIVAAGVGVDYFVADSIRSGILWILDHRFGGNIESATTLRNVGVEGRETLGL